MVQSFIGVLLCMGAAFLFGYMVCEMKYERNQWQKEKQENEKLELNGYRNSELVHILLNMVRKAKGKPLLKNDYIKGGKGK